MKDLTVYERQHLPTQRIANQVPQPLVDELRARMDLITERIPDTDHTRD